MGGGERGGGKRKTYAERQHAPHDRRVLRRRQVAVRAAEEALLLLGVAVAVAVAVAAAARSDDDALFGGHLFSSLWFN